MKYVLFLVVIYFVYKVVSVKKNSKKLIENTLRFTHQTSGDDGETENDTNPLKWQYWDDTNQVPVSASLKIDYINGKDENSSRNIHVSRYDGSVHLSAFCDFRQELRTFRIDRIKSCIDLETGEIVSDLPEHLLKKYRQTAYYLVQSDDRIRESLRILFYIGKADSQMRANERAVICEAIRHISGNEQLMDDDINRAINSLSPLSSQAFKIAVGKLLKIDNATMVNVKKWAADIVNTQKTAHANEIEALAYIDKKIGFITEKAV